MQLLAVLAVAVAALPAVASHAQGSFKTQRPLIGGLRSPSSPRGYQVELVPTVHAGARFVKAGRAVASAYSRHSSGPTNGCDGSPLHDRDLSVATFLVPCGARLRICYRRRCVTATRRDSGPYAAGRQIDLNRGVVWALGFRDELAWGVRTVTWRRVR